MGRSAGYMPCGGRCLFVLLVFLFLAGGCGAGEEPGSSGAVGQEDHAAAQRLIEEAIEKDAGSKVDVDLSGDGLRIRGRGDRRDYSFAAGGKVKVPDNFPEDVSLYPGAEVRMSQVSGRQDVTVILATGDESAAVLDFYRREAAEQGWQLQSEAGLEGEQFLGFTKEKKALSVAADPEPDSTLISISYKVKDF